jgi:uncharacterized protein
VGSTTKTMATGNTDHPRGGGRSREGSGPRLEVDVALLLRRPGTTCPIEVDLTFGDLANSVVVASRVVGALVVESMSDSLSVTGELGAAWRGDCRRCLGEAEGVTTIDVAEIFERRPVDGETYPLQGDVVDLAPMVREQMLLSLPLAPLCDEACGGPDPDRFPSVVPPPDPDAVTEAAAAAPEPGPAGDPRWAALDALRFDDD